MCHPWSFWLRKNLHLPGTIQTFKLWLHYLRRLRRKRKWNGWCPERIPRTWNRWRKRKPIENHAENLFGGKHLQHASRCKRGFHLHWNYYCWVFKGLGLPCECIGRLHFSLGRSSKRDIWSSSWDAYRLGVSSVYVHQAGEVLWKSWKGWVPGVKRRQEEVRIHHYHRGCVSFRGWFQWSSCASHIEYRVSVLGSG